MSSNKIVLTSSDGESFQVEEVVARKLQIVKHLLEDDCVINEIPLQNVTGNILSIVLEYCKKHVDDVVDDDASEEPKKKKPDDVAGRFLNQLKKEMMHLRRRSRISMLGTQSLLGLTCQTVADYIKDKTPEEVRELFNIENDFTHEEEEEAIRKENAWAFEADTKHEDPKP
ncbi:SKP1/BTB/POZ domain superfamily [Arabidopsis suecica]|uniref:SKP1-like protein n=1 Tax=Arabidopsis suecica TaxID=45249 RepID=A0A8T2FEL1_ARASU|nr:SKP1/BTB/POZ domain superfamily [Arabidopsis suecica]